MKIKVVSDIHVEFHKDHGKKWAESQDPAGIDVLVIPGDLGTSPYLSSVLRILCKKFRDVVYVHGNHELYGIDFLSLSKIRDDISRELPNLHWLHNSIAEIGGKRFLGSTMWFRDTAESRVLRRLLNDFTVIEGNFKDEVYRWNRMAISFFKKDIQDGDIVISHHLPSDRHMPQEFIKSALNCYYVCNMEKTILEKKPSLWCHGHTHSSRDYLLGNTRIVCNPYGYQNYILNKEFEDNLIIEI